MSEELRGGDARLWEAGSSPTSSMRTFASSRAPVVSTTVTTLNRGKSLAINCFSAAKRVLPPDHPDIALSMNNLASTHSALGDDKAALELKIMVLASALIMISACAWSWLAA